MYWSAGALVALLCGDTVTLSKRRQISRKGLIKCIKKIKCGVWNYSSYCEVQVFKGAYLFYSFPLANNVSYRNV